MNESDYFHIKYLSWRKKARNLYAGPLARVRGSLEDEPERLRGANIVRHLWLIYIPHKRFRTFC